MGIESGPPGTTIELLLRLCKPLNFPGTWMKMCYNCNTPFYYSNCNGNQKYVFQLKYKLFFLNIPQMGGYIYIAIATKVAKILAVEPGPPGSQSRCSTSELLLNSLHFSDFWKKIFCNCNTILLKNCVIATKNMHFNWNTIHVCFKCCKSCNCLWELFQLHCWLNF